MIVLTETWRPQICTGQEATACVIERSIDREEWYEDGRRRSKSKTILVKYLHTCANHAHIHDDTQRFDAVMNEKGWRPDTCSCQVVMKPPFEFVRFNSLCPFHATIDEAQRFAQFRKENRDIGASVASVADALGVDSTSLDWRIDAATRELTIVAPGLSMMDRKRASSLYDKTRVV